MAELNNSILNDLRDPIRTALAVYQDLSLSRLGLEIDQASDLVLTPDKPNSARSITPVKYLGEIIGTELFVIAFAPGDGTGAESTEHQLSDLGNLLGVEEPYPHTARVIPRSKAGTRQEAHLNVVSQKIDDVHADPILFAGTFDLLGIKGDQIGKIGELGHGDNVLPEETGPIATLTTGYELGPESRPVKFGDPHAVYSRLSDVLQVCAFLAINDADYRRYPGMLSRLNPQKPHQI